LVLECQFDKTVVLEHINFATVVSELKVDERRYVEDRKLYNKVRGREIQWQRTSVYGKRG